MSSIGFIVVKEVLKNVAKLKSALYGVPLKKILYLIKNFYILETTKKYNRTGYNC